MGQSPEPVPAAGTDPADKPERIRTQPVSWTPLPPAASYAATTATAGGTVALTSLLAERQRTTAAWLERNECRRIGLNGSRWSAGRGGAPQD